MGFHTGAWAKIWEMDKRERYTKLRISISKKDKKTDQYIDDFSGFVNLAGSAHTNADMLHVGDRFKIGDCDVFVYSGELENPMLKSWIDYVLAGQRNLVEYRGDSSPYYKVERTALDRMREFYRGRLWIYRDDFSQTTTKMLSVMESMVRRNNAKLCVIDNMTSIDLECNDTNKYFKQDEFIRKIIDFSKKFKCICIVVIHPKKMETMRRMTLFDLQGVVSSVNLAHYVISLYRVQPSDRLTVNPKTGKQQIPIYSDVILDVMKNRLTPGGLGSAELYYDIPSRRFFEDEKSLDVQYKWDRSNYAGVPLPFPPRQLVDEENADAEALGMIEGDDE